MIAEETTKLISLVKLAESIEGRKKFQKIIFILQNEGLDFGKNFKYANFGPYSIDLQIEFDALVNRSVLFEKENNGAFIYSYNKVNHYFPMQEISPEIREKSNLINYLTEKAPQELELVSTIYFLKNKGSEYSNNEIVKRKIAYLKPHLTHKITSAFKIFEKIKKCQFA